MPTAWQVDSPERVGCRPQVIAQVAQVPAMTSARVQLLPPPPWSVAHSAATVGDQPLCVWVDGPLGPDGHVVVTTLVCVKVVAPPLTPPTVSPAGQLAVLWMVVVPGVQVPPAPPGGVHCWIVTQFCGAP